MTRKWTPVFVIIGALGLGGLSELFPLWEYVDGNTSARRSAGYHFYRSPPPVKSDEEMNNLFHGRQGDYPLSISVHPDYFQSIAQRLLLFWLALNLFILSFGRGELVLRVLLWMFVALGGALALLLLWRALA